MRIAFRDARAEIESRDADTLKSWPGREQLSLELDAEVAFLRRQRAAEAQLSEGEVVALALRAFDLRALLAQIRRHSDDAAMALARGELQAARAEARTRVKLRSRGR